MAQPDVLKPTVSGMKRAALAPNNEDFMPSTHIKREDDDAETISDKSPGAFKTISEVADMLGLPQHVLRFWESKFKQIKPLKMRGGRRYYRPDDIEIIATIRHLLYSEGYTINGAKRALDQARKNQRVTQEPAATQAALTVAIQRSAEALPAEKPQAAKPVAPVSAPVIPASVSVVSVPVMPIHPPRHAAPPQSSAVLRPGAPPPRFTLPVTPAPAPVVSAPQMQSAAPAANLQRRRQLESIRDELLGLRDALARLRQPPQTV